MGGAKQATRSAYQHHRNTRVDFQAAIFFLKSWAASQNLQDTNVSKHYLKALCSLHTRRFQETIFIRTQAKRFHSFFSFCSSKHQRKSLTKLSIRSFRGKTNTAHNRNPVGTSLYRWLTSDTQPLRPTTWPSSLWYSDAALIQLETLLLQVTHHSNRQFPTSKTLAIIAAPQPLLLSSFFDLHSASYSSSSVHTPPQPASCFQHHTNLLSAKHKLLSGKSSSQE